LVFDNLCSMDSKTVRQFQSWDSGWDSLLVWTFNLPHGNRYLQRFRHLNITGVQWVERQLCLKIIFERSRRGTNSRSVTTRVVLDETSLRHSSGCFAQWQQDFITTCKPGQAISGGLSESRDTCPLMSQRDQLYSWIRADEPSSQHRFFQKVRERLSVSVIDTAQ
jgi:hypothetical protein